MSNESRAEVRTDWAERRTDWAQDRTILANERTFASWMGAGLGAIGVAIGFKSVFGAAEPTWAAKLAASPFLAIVVAIFWSARRQAQKTLKRLSHSDAEIQPRRNFTVLAAMLTLATLITGTILLSL